MGRILDRRSTPTSAIVLGTKVYNGGTSALYDETNPDWAPSRYLGGAPEPASAAEERYRRTIERKGKRRRIDACKALLSLSTMVSSIARAG